MDEAEWRICNEPMEMLHALREISTMRKLRLFACACCRLVWPLLSDSRSRSVVEVAEQFADGLIDAKALEGAREAAYSVHANTSPPDSGFADSARGMSRSNWEAAQAATMSGMAFSTLDDAIWCCQATIEQASLAAVSSAPAGTSESEAEAKERASQADVLRCIAGNPFRSLSNHSSWLKPAVVALAQAAYEKRSLPGGTLDNAHLAVLADALEEAGCTEASLLSHCRNPGSHVRGCWVVDLVLGKK